MVFGGRHNPHDSLTNEDLNMGESFTDDFDSFGSGVSAEEAGSSSSTSNISSAESDNLPKIIRDPSTGTTYYLDEANQRYYYIDPETNNSVYYNG